MAIVRSAGPGDIVVRYAGRRLRIGPTWAEVSDDALDRLRSEGGDELEEGTEADLGRAVPSSASADEKAPKPKGKGKSSGKAKAEPVDPPEEQSPSDDPTSAPGA